MLYYFDMGAFFCKVKDIYSKKKKHLALLFEKETSNNSIQTVIQFLNKSTTLTVHLKCMYQRIVPYLWHLIGYNFSELKKIFNNFELQYKAKTPLDNRVSVFFFKTWLTYSTSLLSADLY